MTTTSDQVARLLQQEEDTNPFFTLAPQRVGEYALKLTHKAEMVGWHDCGELVAFVAFYCNDPARDLAFIPIMVVARPYRRARVASALLQAALTVMRARAFRRCRLHVHPDNVSAIALYEGAGFRRVGVNPDSVISVVMEADLGA